MNNQNDFQFNFYSLEFDSPLEELLGEQLAKYASFDQCTIEPQYEVNTTGGKFYLDFLLRINQKKYALECDGKEFHKYYADLYRDAWLLGERHIDEMIRFRGCDIVSCIKLCLLYLYKTIPNLFDERYENVFEQEARNERWNKHRKTDPEGEHFYDEIIWSESESLQEECRIWGFDAEIIHRHNRFHNPDKIYAEWVKAYKYIFDNEIKTKEEFVDKYPQRFNSQVW